MSFASAAVTERVSVDGAGVEGNQGGYGRAISADGHVVAFESASSNLVPGDTNISKFDVFVRDLATGQTTRVSVSSSGAEGNGDSGWPAISDDGKTVVFHSGATNLVPGDTNGKSDVFVRDLATGKTTRVSVSSSGAEGNAYSKAADVSADGRVVAFQSTSDNLVPGDTNRRYDIFARDRATGRTTRVSVSSSGVEGNTGVDGFGDSRLPGISANGNAIVFNSGSDNLVPGDTNRKVDVFVRSEFFDQDGGGVPAATDGPINEPAPAPPTATITPLSVTTPDTIKPVLSSLSLTPARFRAASSGPSISAALGTRVSYKLSEKAAVNFRVERAVPGRFVGGRCVRPKRSNRTKRHCTRYVTLRGSFTHRGEAGKNSFKFRGRLGGRMLRPGRYRLRAVATDPAKNRSQPKRVILQIVRH